MPNFGQRTILVKTPSGSMRAMRNEVTECTGAPTATSQMVDANNFVGHSPWGSFMLDLSTGECDEIERVDDCFEMELEVVPCNGAASILKGQGFQRRS